MKHKPLVLAAALAATAGLAQAQSSVTLFGLVDANVTRYRAGSQSGSPSDIALNDGTTNGLNGSRWGLRVSEDLGGGLKVGVLLEGGLSLANGTALQGGRSFGRQSYLSLGGSVGELRVGRQYILSDGVLGQSNPYGNALTLNPGTGVTNVGKALPFFLNAPRVDGALTYISPTLAGFQFSAQITDATATYDRFHGLKLQYADGPLYAALTHEWNTSRKTDDSVNQSTTLAMNYNVGAFKLLGGLQRNRDLALGSGNGAFTGANLSVTGSAGTFVADRSDGWTLGAEVPMGPWLFGGNYTVVKYAAAGGASQNLGKFALGARYGLSKSSFLYTSASTATGDLKDHIAQRSAMQLGMRTAF
ncbi:porin [Ideonella sp. 4Y16]|uniref:porin n=1 Tax=Ideonella alba TaxID=2824118 RepID=UPI001B375977|nr:porin [Ideonella alba]MBQ0945497.1 porin [Ideonella alba]